MERDIVPRIFLQHESAVIFGTMALCQMSLLSLIKSLCQFRHFIRVDSYCHISLNKGGVRVLFRTILCMKEKGEAGTREGATSLVKIFNLDLKTNS